MSQEQSQSQAASVEQSMSQEQSQSTAASASEDTLGGNPTPGGEVPDTALGGTTQVPATLMSLLFLAALGTLAWLRFSEKR